MSYLIGLAGRARVGKSTAAAFLTDCGLASLSFAEPMKRALGDWFGLEDDYFEGDLKDQELSDVFGFSPRYLMQTLGTDWGRRLVHPDAWLTVAGLTLARARADYARQGAQWVGAIFSDVRFDNEAAWIRHQGGHVVHIERRAAPAVRGHASEAGVKRGLQDIVIPNDGTLEELQHRLADMVFRLRDEAHV